MLHCHTLFSLNIADSYVRHPRCVLYNRLVMLVRDTYV